MILERMAMVYMMRRVVTVLSELRVHTGQHLIVVQLVVALLCLWTPIAYCLVNRMQIRIRHDKALILVLVAMGRNGAHRSIAPPILWYLLLFDYWVSLGHHLCIRKNLGLLLLLR